jgi:hypothetical protein
LRRSFLFSVFILLLLGSLLLNTKILATTYAASPYVFESEFENELSVDFEGTQVTGGAGAKLERDTNVFYYPTHSLHVVAPPVSNSLQYAWTNFDHISEIYARFYVYFPEGSLFLYPDAWAGGEMDYWLYFLGGLAYLEPNGTEPRCDRTGSPLFTWGSLRLIYFPQSADRAEGYYFSGTTWNEGAGNRVYAPFDNPTPDAFPIETGRWYCLEVHHKMASGPGENDGLAELWVDGTFENGQYTSAPYLKAYNIDNYEPQTPYYGAIEIGNREIPPSSTPGTTPNLEIYVDSLKIDTKPIGTEPEEDLGIPLKWGFIVLGGYDYYARQEINAIQRVEHWIQAQGVPYDLFSDDDIQAPADTPSPGKYPLQYSNNNTRYQVLVIIANSYQDSSAVNVNYIYSAVNNGSNAVVFSTAIRMVPDLFGVSGSISTTSGTFSCNILKSFDDGIQPYSQGDVVNISNIYYRPTLSESAANTVWFTMDSDVGMMNGTYGHGKVWYVGYTPNDFSMVEDPWYMSWEASNLKLLAHAINFAFGSAQTIPVSIMPYKRWNGVIIHTVDICHPQQDWMIDGLLANAEEAAQKGWVYEALFTVMGDGNDYNLVDGFPSGYTGEPSNLGIKYTESGVLMTHLGNVYRKLILYVSGEHGTKYDKIKVDFDGDGDFSDEGAYGCWENISDPSWTKNGYPVTYMWVILDDRDFINPTQIGFVGWVSLESIDPQQKELLRELGANYGWGYDFHGWLHHSYLGTTQDLGTYYRFTGNYSASGFVADEAWLEQKFLEARDQMIAVFGSSGNGFDANFMGNADPGGVDRPKEARDVMEKYMEWKRIPAVVDLPDGGSYDIGARDVGWFLPDGKIPIMLADVGTEISHGSATTLQCFSVFIDMAQTLYPVVPIHQHVKYYEPSINFTPYSNMPGMANAEDSLIFWTESKKMLESTQGHYFNNKIVLEFTANSNLTEFVWKFPYKYQGKYFISFSDNCSVGQVVKTDGETVYVEFSQGAGNHRIEVIYGKSGDETPPTIGAPTQEPTTVMPYQNVTISVNVTDESGVSEVILSYSTDGGATWINTTMNKATGDIYEGDIPGFPAINVRYQIIAYDNVGNVAVKNNSGHYYVYTVIPEFSTWPVFLATLVVISIFMIFAKKRLPSSRR